MPTKCRTATRRLANFLLRAGHGRCTANRAGRASRTGPKRATTSSGSGRAADLSGLSLLRTAQTRVSPPSTASSPPLKTRCSTSKLERRNSATREAISISSPKRTVLRQSSRTSTSGKIPKTSRKSRRASAERRLGTATRCRYRSIRTSVLALPCGSDRNDRIRQSFAGERRTSSKVIPHRIGLRMCAAMRHTERMVLG